MEERKDTLAGNTGAGSSTASTTTAGETFQGRTSGDTPSDSAYGTISASESKTGRLAERAQALKGRVTEGVASKARGAFDEQKERAVGTVGSFGHAMRSAAESLRSEGQAPIAHLFEFAADRVDGLSSSIDGRDLDRVVHDVQQFARRHPGIFFGGAVLAGFAAARFIKASTERYSMGALDDDFDDTDRSFATRETSYEDRNATSGSSMSSPSTISPSRPGTSSYATSPTTGTSNLGTSPAGTSGSTSGSGSSGSNFGSGGDL
jgi:hypothetical protein